MEYNVIESKTLSALNLVHKIVIGQRVYE